MNYRPRSPGRVPGFSFKNMVIGIVVNVMNAENEKLKGGRRRKSMNPRCATSTSSARQALLNGDSLIATTAAIGTSSPSSIAVIISQPSSL